MLGSRQWVAGTPDASLTAQMVEHRVVMRSTVRVSPDDNVTDDNVIRDNGELTDHAGQSAGR